MPSQKKRPCHCCGKLAAMRFKVNREHGGGKARVAHKCPHGKPCVAGDPLNGLHANRPLPASLGGCPACNEREVKNR